jgi:hypothetical protein
MIARFARSFALRHFPTEERQTYRAEIEFAFLTAAARTAPFRDRFDISRARVRARSVDSPLHSHFARLAKRSGTIPYTNYILASRRRETH